ncbi:MAG: metallophosphoesterase, partial [Myxococcota bacterium]
MIDGAERLFWVLTAVTWIGVPLYAAVARGRLYALFSGILLSFSLPSLLILHDRLRALISSDWEIVLDVLFCYAMTVTAIQFGHLAHARMRGLPFRWLVSVPSQTFIAGGMLATPWLIVLFPIRLLFAAADWQTALILWTLVEAAPLAIAGLSIVTSLTTRLETVRFQLSHEGPESIERVAVERVRGHQPVPHSERPLRIVQITDTHLGPWQSVRQLRDRIEQLIACDPDLVLLTGDFLTMESMGSPGCLEEALQPLIPLAGRSAAIFGNHDHEAPDQVRKELQAIGIRLLVDDEACFESPAGRVQVVGADYVGQDRKKHLSELLGRFPRRDDHLRLLLLHDPLAFHALPDDEVDLVLSGHTHGGQVGLVSLGIDWTVLS